MKKKTYTKPSMQVIELHHQSALLVGSGGSGEKFQDAPNAPEYNDWFE